MKSRKNTIKSGGGGYILAERVGKELFSETFAHKDLAKLNQINVDLKNGVRSTDLNTLVPEINNPDAFYILGGSKRKSRKSRKSRKTKKTKKGRGTYEGGKKKCPKHCRRKTRRSRKRLKHRKN